MKLHITPEQMGGMFFYDIMMLYDRYKQYVEEENEAQENQQKAYEENYQQNNINPSDMMRNVQNSMPNYNNMNIGSLTKGFKGI